MSDTKNPILSEAGRIAARQRWGRRRHVRLDTLPEPVRRAVEALIETEAAAQQRAGEAPDAA